MGERAALLALFATEVSRVLCDERDFLDALCFEFLGFGNNVFDTAGNLLAADKRDGAVGSAAVAAFGNLQVGVVLESAQVHARQVLCIASLRCHDAHLLQKFARPVGADPVIDFGEFLY